MWAQIPELAVLHKAPDNSSQTSDHPPLSHHLQQENALRSIARQANSEIKKARQQFPDKNVDDICRSVLKKHRETVTLMGFTPTHLSLAIGMLNGVFKER